MTRAPPKVLTHWVSTLQPEEPPITVLFVAKDRYNRTKQSVIYKDHMDSIWREDLETWYVGWSPIDSCAIAYCIYPDEL